jgi:endonuclease/exonuclease/phosphatase (EEP) superfamily protein YafD
MTKYNGWIRVRIDHVLTDASVAVLGAFVAGDEGSDHRPLVVDVALQESR